MTLPKKIMIVEDEVITQRYLKDILEQKNVETIICVDNAVDTLQMLQSGSYEMILMDINIKGHIDGISLAKEILKTYQIPIIFITAYTDEKTLDEVLELSPYGFISKPFTSKEIIIALQIAYKRFLIYEASKKENIDTTKSVVITERYTFSQDTSTLYDNKKAVKLSARQQKLLEILVKNLNHTVLFDDIHRYIWEIEIISNSTLRTLVYSVRKQLPELPLCSYSKQGYYLKTD